jgi:hypothetical protein
MTDFSTTLDHFRKERYGLTDVDRIRASADALEFTKRVGFCLLSSKKGIQLPDLAGIADGPYLRWKDEIVKSKQVFYGRPFRRRSGFLRLDLLPSLYVLSPTADFGGDRFELYKRRFLSADANRIAGIVWAKGPLPTRALRRESGMAGHQHRDRFLRRLAEAESRFLIVKAGLTTIEASHYSYLWEPFASVFPDVIDESQDMAVDTAATRIMTTYLATLGAATIRQVAVAFTLNEAYVRYLADHLVEERVIARFSDTDRELLISNELQARL